MISLLKDKSFVNNLLNLVFLRVVSRILPLFMQGYILHATGVISFGGLGFAKSIAYCFTTIISYGGYYVVPKYIALLSKDCTFKNNIGHFFTSRIIMQLIAAWLCYMLYLIMITFIPAIYIIKDFLFWFFIVAIASAMFPIGFFQGINKMYVVSIINPMTKIIIYTCIPIFIHTPDDAIIYPKIFAMAEIIRLLVSYVILIFSFKIPVVRPKLSLMMYQFKDGVANFFYDCYMLFYSHFPVIFLGILVNREVVTVYKIGDRLAKIVRDVLEPFLQSLYPIMNKLFRENLSEGFSCAKKIILWNLIITLPFCMACYVFADTLVMYFGGKSLSADIFNMSVVVLKIHSFLPLLVTTSSIIGLQIITPLKMGRYYTAILVCSSISAVIMHFVLVPQYKSIGAAYAILGGEIITFVGIVGVFIYYLKRVNINR